MSEELTVNTYLPVLGYTGQGAVKIEAVNENKLIEERVLRQLEELKNVEDVDGRWLAIAKTHIEQGFMAMNRAVFRPGRVALPEDADKLNEE